jgi:hypothetical protein
MKLLPVKKGKALSDFPVSGRELQLNSQTLELTDSPFQELLSTGTPDLFLTPGKRGFCFEGWSSRPPAVA